MNEQDVPRLELDNGQKIAIALLLCITALLIVAVIFQFRITIYSYGKRVTRAGALPALNDAERNKKEVAALKAVDTDADGISDFDELNIFRTSPYIADTDSDGTRDGEEIRRGTSPNCPEGKDCSINPLVTSQAPEKIGGATSTSFDTQQKDANAFQDILNLSPKDIREALIASGVPADKVNAISDEQLIQIVREAQAEYKQQQPVAEQKPSVTEQKPLLSP